ncbi:MAG: AMP-binding protein [Thermomicrobiales bacterium]
MTRPLPATYPDRGTHSRHHANGGASPLPVPSTSLYSQVIAACRARPSRIKLGDSTGAKLSGIDTLVRALVLRRVLRREFLGPEDGTVALLLPPTVAAAVANLALVLDRRVTVNLNYTLTPATLDDCVARAGVKHVLTSRAFLAKVPIDLKNAEFIYLEDLRDKASPLDKLRSYIDGKYLPTGALLAALGVNHVPENDLFTIIFSSGTTGKPKGVMLSFGNVTSNLEGVDHVINWNPDDVVIGVLPFFHSFGSTITLWAVMTRDVTAVYHANPLEAQTICKLTQEWGGTILPATPMFIRTYLRRCTPEEFNSLAIVAIGAERMPPTLAKEFLDRYGLDTIQGYGSTEMAPLVSANVPRNRARVDPEVWNRTGTVGRPVPGVMTRVVDPETFEDVPPGEPGLLLVNGPNRMLGYLGDPAATAEALHDGWYITGDIASVDADGFISLKDRQSRFAKIAGEMIPFGAVEDALLAILGSDDAGGPRAVVTAIPDDRRGERLVVVHTPVDKTPTEIVLAIAAANLPKRYRRGGYRFVEVPALPVIGAGKLDLKALKDIAKNGASPAGSGGR